MYGVVKSKELDGEYDVVVIRSSDDIRLAIERGAEFFDTIEQANARQRGLVFITREANKQAETQKEAVIIPQEEIFVETSGILTKLKNWWNS